MIAKNIRVIFDTNVWISFLIGKRLSSINSYINSGQIIIITSEQLIQEINEVTGRKKLKKYFPQQSVTELIELLETISEKYKTRPIYFNSRDVKDNFLLDLIYVSKANYLVTGDKDLLTLNPFKTATIISPLNFEKIISKKL